MNVIKQPICIFMIYTKTYTRMTLFSYQIKYEDPVTTFSALHDLPYSLLFDSALPGHSANGYSYILFMPAETIEARGRQVIVTNSGQQQTFNGNPFRVLQGRLDCHSREMQHRINMPPFQGGAAGMFGYDLARNLEDIPEIGSSDPNMPDMAVGIYHQAICFDHDNRTAFYMVQAESQQEAAARYHHLQKLMDNSRGLPELNVGEAEWSSNIPRSAYLQKVRKALDYIHAGDIFQANLSQRFDAELPSDFNAFAHYCHLRKVNPAPFASYMNFGPVKIASASPERFIRVQDRAVETRPIKGTRPRLFDPAIDQLFRNQLENSEKDRAENAMIVDLLRNDLSKVCEDHSIDVPTLFGLESFAKVHHLVSTVTGSLRIDKSPVDLLEACFPGGSVTGCPKVRAMEIIEELEPTRRGPYCGSLGFIGFNGNMDTSIAIRTLVYNGNSVSFQTGGGIVSDSDPAAEYQETFDKAEAIFNSFEIDAGTDKLNMMAKEIA